ncbi:hypothetical protein GC209_00530 [bacterium]|nr:hypothetical protein [bacterium]
MTDWAERTRPIAKGEAFRIQGIDLSNRIMGLDDLFFVVDHDHFRPRTGEKLRFLNQELLNVGTLRNSFYPQVLAAHAQNMDLSLHVRFSGRFQVIVYQSRPGQAAVPLAERILSSQGQSEDRIELGSLGLLPRAARLFWVARALNDSCELFGVTWQGRAPAATEGRMIVLIRTYGRTSDVQNLLRNLQTQAALDDYSHVLSNIFFLIYDSSPGLNEASYAELNDHAQLNTFVMSGPNMGGGGNMSVELLTLQQALQASGVTVNEMVLTDDDLQISLETLARNWGTTLFRKDNAFHTLPVFMQSDPRRMWEDGGFWGRFTADSPRGQRTVVAPRLLRHNQVFRSDDHIDDMARLHHAEYSTFIFLSMPHSRLGEIGFPAAFFLRGDDIEFNLRHALAGGVTVSNPNLAAWHEPAHSYAQEYMSIAHGVIINMAYGQDRPDELASFFHGRAMAHISVSDVAGLTVYAEALADLVAKDRLMEPNFPDHYIAMIARYKSFDSAFVTLPDEVVENLAAASKKAGKVTAVAPFLYMPVQGSELVLDRVVLWNPHTDRRNIYDPHEPERLTALATVAARFYAALSAFTAGYDTLRAHYCQRLQQTSSEAFWLQLTKSAPFEVLHG